MFLLAVNYSIEAVVSDTRVSYSSDILKSLRPLSVTKQPLNYEIPAEIRKRKRGRRGGVRARLRRRPFKPFLPTVVMGNARSLNNKIDELRGNCRYLREYRESSIICFSESWFDHKVDDSQFKIPGFQLIRQDRDCNSGKKCGGGVCLFVNERYCHQNNINLIHKSCSPDLEILSVKIRPFYLPREFPSIIINLVYIPPDANYANATDTIADAVNEQLAKSPDAAVYIMGDFNQSSLDLNLYNFKQYVNIPTRNDCILDLFYCNIFNAYSCSALAPIGNSVHNMLLFTPIYKPILKRKSLVKKHVSVFDTVSEERLQDCFDLTDWNVFMSACDSVSELCDTVSAYICFCENEVSESKDIVIYPNSKPWVNKEVKSLLSDKQSAFKKQDRSEVKKIDKSIKKAIRSAKLIYKNKLEDHLFKSNDSKTVWNCLKTITGFGDKKDVNVQNVNKQYLNEMNSFFARFEDKDNVGRECQIYDVTNEENVVIEEWEVKSVFTRVKARKACGPDGVKPRVLKVCASQLSFIFSYIMNWTLCQHNIPSIWKTSEILPIPKRPIKELNDYRPVALTSVVMKCLEKLVLKRIKSVFFGNPRSVSVCLSFWQKC